MFFCSIAYALFRMLLAVLNLPVLYFCDHRCCTWVKISVYRLSLAGVDEIERCDSLPEKTTGETAISPLTGHITNAVIGGDFN